jgi:predicted Zn-dependent protease
MPLPASTLNWRRPAALLLCAALGGCATVVNPVTGREERSVMSEEAEIAEGRKAHQQVLQEYGVYDDARVQAYVDGLGQRLARQSHRAHLKWTFTVLDSPEINAFALPGGYVYVTRGIMAYMESEADLAGVIGHEIGHVTARHGAQRATRQQTAGLGVLAATVLGAAVGAGDLASQLSQGVAAGYVASYSREQELQADRLGAEYLARNRYSPRNMVDVIEVLKNQERYAGDRARAEGRTQRQGGDWLASHPSNDQRLQEIRRIAGGYDAAGYDDDGRGRYLQLIDGLPFGESREQGVTRGQRFFHEPLGFALEAPDGWRVQNGREAVVIVNGAGDAGLILQTVPEKAGNSHEEILRKVFNPTQGRTDRREINGFAATHFVGTARNAKGETREVTATVVTGPQRRHYLLLHAAKDAAALRRAAAGLREAEASFRALKASDRDDARPWTIGRASYPRGGFEQLARRSPLPNAEAQLRLINGHYGGGEPRQGQTVKVVE